MLKLVPDGDGFLLEMYAVAADGTIFAEKSADHLVGRTTPIAIGYDEPEYVGEIVAAEVVDDGKAIKFTVKLGNMPPELAESLEYRSFMH